MKVELLEHKHAISKGTPGESSLAFELVNSKGRRMTIVFYSSTDPSISVFDCKSESLETCIFLNRSFDIYGGLGGVIAAF